MRSMLFVLLACCTAHGPVTALHVTGDQVYAEDEGISCHVWEEGIDTTISGDGCSIQLLDGSYFGRCVKYDYFWTLGYRAEFTVWGSQAVYTFDASPVIWCRAWFLVDVEEIRE